MRSNGMGYAKRKEALTNAIRGWVSYFRYADAKGNLQAIDEWLRRRIRMCIWKSWKNPKTRIRNLMRCGMEKWRACKFGYSDKGYWAVAGSGIMQVAVSNRNLARAGYPTLLGYYERYHRM